MQNEKGVPFELKLPTGIGAFWSWLAPQSLQLALPGSSSRPHQKRVEVPALAAYSHSASLGRR